MTPLFLTKELVHRLDKIEFECTRNRMEAIRQVAGDAVGIEFFCDGGVFGLMAKAIPNPFFNRVFGRLNADAELVGDLAKRYLACGAPLSFEVSPGVLDGSLAATLTRLGFANTAFHPMLVAAASNLATARPGHHVEVIAEPGDALEAFKDVYLDGWAIAPGFAPTLRGYIDHWLGHEEWTLYLARIDGEPVAVGVLHQADGIGYLADATTAKAHRGKGGQHAVLQARVRDAAQAGCAYIMSRADFDSTSQRNMERLGLQVSYTRAVWTRS